MALGEVPSAHDDAIAAERARIMRELDDTVSKSLLGVAMIAESLAAHCGSADPLELDRQLNELASLAREAVSDARSIISGLNDEMLGAGIAAIATEWSDLTGIAVELDLESGLLAPPDIRRQVMAIVSEALSNVERHARASAVNVSLRSIDDRILIGVADDGRGFCVPADVAGFAAVGRSGLAAMEQRVRQLGGSLIVTSWPGLGAHVDVELPAPTMVGQWLRAAPQAPPVSVVIADGNPVLRRGLRACLERSPRIRVAAEADNGQRALALARSQRPDVLLLDVGLLGAGEISGIAASGAQTQVVVLASRGDAALVRHAVQAGASGYVIHGDFGRDELIGVILDTARHRPVPSGPQADHPRPRMLTLRPREREVMGLIAEGLTNRQIAARLVISEKTVKNHICSIYQYFGVHERSKAVGRWLELIQESAPLASPLLGLSERRGWPVHAGAPGDGDGGDRGVHVQLAQHVLDMGAHSIS
jgi:DNA-binding NarL/FixJ family response regulator